MSATESGGYSGEHAFPADEKGMTSYSDLVRKRFHELVDAQIKDAGDIKFHLFVQAIAMDYLQRTHLEHIKKAFPQYIDTPAPASAFFSDEFAEMFEREFRDESGLRDVKDAIFQRHSPERAIRKIEEFTESWWTQKQAE